MKTAEQLIEELNALDENVTIEAKAGSSFGTSALETVGAFANEPSLGADRKQTTQITLRLWDS